MSGEGISAFQLGVGPEIIIFLEGTPRSIALKGDPTQRFRG